MNTDETDGTLSRGLSQAAEAYQSGDIDTACTHLDGVLDRITAMMAELEAMRVDVEQRLKARTE